MTDLEKLSQALAGKGKLIESGFVALRLTSMDPAAPPIQVQEMRMAYMAGAQHLFSSIMTILEPGDEEPTEKDLRRMDLIAKELEDFYNECVVKLTPTKGSA